MNPTLGENLRIFVFEGDRNQIKHEVDQWLTTKGVMFEVVDIQYNYQAPECDDQGQAITEGMHGVLIVARQLTMNECRERSGERSV